MKTKGRRSVRQQIALEQLKKDPNSLLSWGIDDPTLRKLETYRLYQAGTAVADIAEAFEMTSRHLYRLWQQLEEQGLTGLVDKRGGSQLRQRTPKREAAVLRAKAVTPQKGDTELAKEFGMERTTVYKLLKEHGLQDLHRVLHGDEIEEQPENQSEPAKKKKLSSVTKHSF
ncbi:MAG: helix-turn-helix domain-containing protein [Planctomycetes bacterium]|nr:helix-turn-helix domain-containing protein [Planctomycetota bacterium]